GADARVWRRLGRGASRWFVPPAAASELSTPAFAAPDRRTSAARDAEGRGRDRTDPFRADGSGRGPFGGLVRTRSCVVAWGSARRARLDGDGFRRLAQQPEFAADAFVDRPHDVGIVLEELLGVLAALTQPLAAVR